MIRKQNEEIKKMKEQIDGVSNPKVEETKSKIPTVKRHRDSTPQPPKRPPVHQGMNTGKKRPQLLPPKAKPLSKPSTSVRKSSATLGVDKLETSD